MPQIIIGVANMCDYTNRRNDEQGWECPCPYRDRCERAACNNDNAEYGRGRNNGCGERRSNGCGNGRSNRRNGCSICNLFRGCCNR